MTLPPGMQFMDMACLCSVDYDENITGYNSMCPLHKHLAIPPKELKRPWCNGSSAPVREIVGRTGKCCVCRYIVFQKHGYAGVHLPDGTTPHE